MDNYTPTINALEATSKNMAKGSIICFDQLNYEFWPGKCCVKEFFDLEKLKLINLVLIVPQLNCLT